MDQFFRIDDLLDFSNDELFSSSSSTDFELHHRLPTSENTSASDCHFDAPIPNRSTNFTDYLCVPNDDVAELEWLSNFVDDSFSDYPKIDYTGTANLHSNTSFHFRSRNKRSTAIASNTKRTSPAESDTSMAGKSKTDTHISHTKKRESSFGSSSLTGDRSSSESARRCTHCAAEKTPQWRSGPSGPKTLCNACGVRYKSGRLVPEYRPAASPTFVLAQHSNSHRKIMELRRQKEMLH